MEIVNFLGNRLGSGGIESFINNVSADMIRYGYCYTICTNYSGESIYIDRLMQSGVRIEHIVDQHANYFYKMISYAKYMRRKKNSIIHIHASSASMYPYVFVARIIGVKKIIYHVHSTSNPMRSRTEILKDAVLAKLFRHIPDINLGCSEEACASIFKNRSYTVINNGIDVNRFKFNQVSREKIRKELGYEGCFVIGQVGRYSFQKNQIFTLKIMDKLKMDKTIKCILIGEGQDKQKLQDYIAKHHLEECVEICEPKDNIEDYYQAMDIFAFPSVYEGFGIVALEAQVAGLPILCSESIIEGIKLSRYVETMPINDVDKWIKSIWQHTEQMLIA